MKEAFIAIDGKVFFDKTDCMNWEHFLNGEIDKAERLNHLLYKLTGSESFNMIYDGSREKMFETYTKVKELLESF